MFRKITLIIIALVGFNANAQFTIDEDTLYAFGFVGATSADFSDIYAHTVIRSKAPSPDTIKWNRFNVVLPSAEWSTAICDILSCRGPEISSDTFAFSGAGDTGILSFHFYTKNIRGNGVITVRFSRANNPLDFKDVVIIAQGWAPTGVSSSMRNLMNVYPNPVNDYVNINNPLIGKADLKVFNAQGQIVFESAFDSSARVDLSNFASGLYTIVVQGEKGSTSTTFVKS
jgi:hypothetical protein